jgi:predicted nucleic acid-binding protein
MNHADRMKVVLDTNVLVAAGFEECSASSRIVDAVRAGRIALIWDASTRAETRRVLRQIPPLSWEAFADLYSPDGRYDGPTPLAEMAAVRDSADRKFAALAVATGAVLLSNDDHLLSARDRIHADVLKPAQFLEQYLDD